MSSRHDQDEGERDGSIQEGSQDDTNHLTRRRTIQGMGAVFGTATIACGDDALPPSADDGSSSSDGNWPDGGTTTTTGVADGTTSGGGGSGSEGFGESSSGGDTTGPNVEDCEGNGGLSPEELLAEIDTIVVVMMENRSFDHYFGSATFLEGWTLDGLTGDETNPRVDGTPLSVYHLQDTVVECDPPHSWMECHLQWNLGGCDGFVTRMELDHPDCDPSPVMGYHTRLELPVLYALADNYVLCDRWFSSVLGPTWPNRFFMHSGTSGGQMANQPEASLAKIWDVLEDAGLSATNYYSDLAWAWGGYGNPLASYTESINDFFDAAAAGTLPNFSIVDPHFGILGGAGGNDDHPPHDAVMGQVFLASVYQALAASPQWERCLLVITYDEHGGFYDHVSPPTVDDPLVDFQQLGFRVPSLIIGPHVRQGCIDSTQYDHVSIPSTATRRFELAPLNARVTQTADVSNAINPIYLGNPRPPAPIPQLSVSVSEVLQRHHQPAQPELAAMVESGQIPRPPSLQGPDASRQLALQLLDRAQKLGVVTLRP